VPQDPFTGRALAYRITPDSYVVYSISQDGIDGGGALYGLGSGGPMRQSGGASNRGGDVGVRLPISDYPVFSQRRP
jgi:hypothetical protein